MEIFKLFGSIFVDSSEANKSLDETDKKGKNVASTLGSAIGTAAKWGTAIVGGASAAVGGLIAATSKTAEYADEIDKLSERTGINREELQRWKYAAGRSGADIGKLEVGVKKLSDEMANAMAGNDKAIESFGKLGISLDDLKNKSQEEIFDKVMTGLADMEQGAQRNALGNDLLGKSYTEMLPLLNAGSQGMEDLKKRADELGIVMSEDAVKANVQFGDTLDDVKQTFGGLTRELTDAALPMLQGFLDFILQNMPSIKETFGNVFGALSSAVQSVLPFLMDLISNALPPMISLFTDIATNILPPVIALFTQIVQAVLPPLIQLFIEYIQTVLPIWMEQLDIIINDILPPFIQLLTDVINTVLPPLMDLFNQIISTLLPPLIDLFKQIIDAVMPVIIELFNEFTKTVLPPLMELIDEIVQVVLPPLLDLFNDLAQVVLPLVMTVFQAMLPVIEPIMNTIASVIKTVLALIKGDWEGVWNGLKDIVSNVWETIKGIVKAGINFVIGGINTFIRGLNKIKIPDWVPLVGGKGINIKEIPLLAAGGEITEKGHAIVGEAGPELLELPQGAKVKPLSDETQEANQIINNFNIAKLHVREEADIQKIARELFLLQQSKSRGLGVSTT